MLLGQLPTSQPTRSRSSWSASGVGLPVTSSNKVANRRKKEQKSGEALANPYNLTGFYFDLTFTTRAREILVRVGQVRSGLFD